MADKPVFVLVGELVPGGLVRAQAIDVSLPSDYEKDHFNTFSGHQAQDQQFDLVDRQAFFGNAAPVFYWNQVGVSLAISAISDNGDGTSRITTAAHGKTTSRFPVVLRGVRITTAPDPNAGLVWATRVDATNFDVPVVTAGGSYAFTATQVVASGGRTIEFYYAYSAGNPDANDAVIEASSGSFISDGYVAGMDIAVTDSNSPSNAFSRYTAKSVTATKILLDQKFAGPVNAGPWTSGVTIDGTSIAGLPSVDLAPNANQVTAGAYTPNSFTEHVHGEYPSEFHGADYVFLGRFITAILDSNPPFGLDASDTHNAAILVQVKGTEGTLGPLDADSFGITGIAAAGVDTEITCAEPHGIVGSDYVFLSGIEKAQTPDISGYHLFTVTSTTTGTIAVTSSAFPTGSSRMGTLSTRHWPIARGDITGDNLDVSLGSPATKAWRDIFGTFTEYTTQLASTTTGDVLVFSGESNDDYFAIGFGSTFSALYIDTGTAGVAGTVTWEYWNGAWTALSGVTDGTTGFTVTGIQRVSWTLPVDWATTTLNAESTAHYYVRAKVTNPYTPVDPIVDQGWIGIDHGMATGGFCFLGGVTGHTPEEVNGKWVVTVIDGARFSIPLKTTTVSTTIANGFCLPRSDPTGFPPASRSHQVGEGRDGGTLYDRLLMQVEGCLRQIEESGDTPFIAGMFFNWGYNDDAPIMGSVIDTLSQMHGYWGVFGEFMRQVRQDCYDLSVTHGQTVHTAVTDIPVVNIAYDPTQVKASNYTSTFLTIGSKLLPSVLHIRNQMRKAYGQLGDGASVGKVAEIDPTQITGVRRKNIDTSVFFTGDSIIPLGERMFDTWNALRASGPTVPTGEDQAVPTYLLMGQSQTVGVHPCAFLAESGEEVYDGSHFGVETRLEFIWDWAQRLWVEFTGSIGGGDGNSNTHPLWNAGFTGVYGPDVSLIRALRERHPDGVYLFKLANPGAPLQPVPGLVASWDPDTGPLYPDLLDGWAEAKAQLALLGKVPDVRGVFWDQGEGDTAAPWPDTYQAALTAFIARVRQDFSTRTATEAALPFIIARLQDHDRQTFDQTGVDTIRAAMATIAAGDSRVAVADIDSCQIIEDDVHRSGRGNIEAGLRMSLGLDGITGMNAPRTLDLGLKADEYGIPTGQTGTTGQNPSSGSGSPFEPAVG